MLNHKEHFNKKKLIENIGSDNVFMKLLLETYFKSFGTFIDTIVSAIKKNDKELFKKTVHSIKGSSATICFEIMTDLLEQIENIEFDCRERIFDLLKNVEKEFNFLKQKYLPLYDL